MLQDSFYRVLERSGPDEEITPSGMPMKKFSFSLQTDPAHVVFEGHFPGNPVTPGVFQVRMIHELTESVTGMPLRMTSADNIKYLSLMVPSLHRDLRCSLSLKETGEKEYSVNATISAAEIVFIKFKGIFNGR